MNLNEDKSMAKDDRELDDIQGTLRHLREEYWRGLEEEAEEGPAEVREVLVLRLGKERLGVDPALAREVLRIPAKLVPVPKAAEFIRGIVNVRGEILAVTDLRPFLGLPGRDIPANGRLIVVEAGGICTALLATEVEGMHAFDREQVAPLTEGAGNLPRDVFTGQVRDADSILLLLDLEEVFRRQEFVIDRSQE